MSPLREKLINDMTVRGFAENTQQAYLRAVVDLSRFYCKSPDQLTVEQVQSYLLHLIKDRGLAPASCNIARYGLRFFYRITLGWPDSRFYIPGSRQPKKLPDVLSQEEVVRLFAVTSNKKHRALLMATYAAGLRVSETIGLRVTDVDSDRMCLKINQSKGHKDRFVPLSARLLDELRDYWRERRPASWLFPGSFPDRHMNRRSAADAFIQARKKAGIAKRGGIHCLRHSWATHMVEGGTDLQVLQQLMGHRNLRTTLRYLHIARQCNGTAPSPLDLLALPDVTRH